MENFSMSSTITKLKANKIALLDADYIKYIVCDRRKKDYLLEKENNSINVFHPEEPIIIILKDYLSENIFDKIEDPIIFCFSGKSYNTYRNHVAFDKKYKDKRSYDETYPGQSEDAHLIVKYIKEKYLTLLFDDLEADDIVSALQCDKTYILSKDKDLKQVPGFHYDFQLNQIYEIKKEQAAYNLAFQLLIGDSTDNITGIPQYGPKKAQDFLAQISNPRHYVLKVAELYQIKFGVFKGIDMFAETWNLVKLRENRGSYFKSKYQLMFDTKEYILRTQLK